LVKLERDPRNPILTPRPEHKWECSATFNPGAIRDGDSIHILYRAVDDKGTSSLGYAKSVDGVTISERLERPVMKPEAESEEWGCEDPRITKLDGQYWVLYTAYSRRGPRIALASTKDFRTFQKYGVVGPDYYDKDCVLFPERIGSRIAILHRIEPNVQIAYFNDLGSLKEPKGFWTSYMKDLDSHVVMYREFPWEAKKMGIGPPPIKTADGWLVLYHGVDPKRVYRVGAALLDLADPSKVLGRTREPILEPEEEFERRGVVPNVVFPVGLVLLNGTLLVYYGGADKVVCLASAPLKAIIESLKAG